MRATYANCFAPGHAAGELLLTEEPEVAATGGAGRRAVIVDRLIDPEQAQAANIALWDLAFRWAQIGGDDVTMVDGISAADLGGGEAILHTLIPAGRGALGMLAALDSGLSFEALTTVVADGGSASYRHTEAVQAAAAAAAARARLGGALTVHEERAADPRNSALFAKYAATRDVDSLSPALAQGQRRRSAFTRAANLAAAMRGRRGRSGTLLVYEYNPTRAFAERYGARADRSWRLARLRCAAGAVPAIIAAGDRVAPAPQYPTVLTDPEVGARLREACEQRSEELEAAFTLAGVPLWPVVGPALIETAERNAAFARTAVPGVRRALERLDVDAVLVPFESPPDARAVIRVAQSMGIPTHILSDGFKGDDFGVDGTLADVALSWSTAMAEHYYCRRKHGRIEVTGNPKADQQVTAALKREPAENRCRILVGPLTFSPADINCRRSDPEEFLAGVLDGISRSRIAEGAEITIKLHPADRVDHYEQILSRDPRLKLSVIDQGDIVALFHEHDIYIATYSTSLIEAVPLGLPVVYFRVNPQRIHAPFSNDPLLESRTAADADGLASLLDRAETFTVPPATAGREWAERYLGPTDGKSVQRIVDAIDTTLTRLPA